MRAAAARSSPRLPWFYGIATERRKKNKKEKGEKKVVGNEFDFQNFSWKSAVIDSEKKDAFSTVRALLPRYSKSVRHFCVSTQHWVAIRLFLLKRAVRLACVGNSMRQGAHIFKKNRWRYPAIDIFVTCETSTIPWQLQLL